MPQIAQQDYIYVKIADSESFTDSEKAELRKYQDAGNILDVVLLLGNNTRSKIIASSKSEYVRNIIFFDDASQELVNVSIA